MKTIKNYLLDWKAKFLFNQYAWKLCKIISRIEIKQLIFLEFNGNIKFLGWSWEDLLTGWAVGGGRVAVISLAFARVGGPRRHRLDEALE